MTENVFTRRCNAQERQCTAFRHSEAWNTLGSRSRTEPALGTLDERLGIIVRRLGGRTGPVRATARERQDYADWCRNQGIDNPLYAP